MKVYAHNKGNIPARLLIEAEELLTRYVIREVLLDYDSSSFGSVEDYVVDVIDDDIVFFESQLDFSSLVTNIRNKIESGTLNVDDYR